MRCSQDYQEYCGDNVIRTFSCFHYIAEEVIIKPLNAMLCNGVVVRAGDSRIGSRQLRFAILRFMAK